MVLQKFVVTEPEAEETQVRAFEVFHRALGRPPLVVIHPSVAYSIYAERFQLEVLIDVRLHAVKWIQAAGVRRKRTWYVATLQGSYGTTRFDFLNAQHQVFGSRLNFSYRRGSRLNLSYRRGAYYIWYVPYTGVPKYAYFVIPYRPHHPVLHGLVLTESVVVVYRFRFAFLSFLFFIYRALSGAAPPIPPRVGVLFFFYSLALGAFSSICFGKYRLYTTFVFLGSPQLKK